MQYAYMMVFFATILTFSTIAPLILPFGLLYFVFKHFLDIYLLVHIRPREFDSDGSMLWYANLRAFFQVNGSAKANSSRLGLCYE